MSPIRSLAAILAAGGLALTAPALVQQAAAQAPAAPPAPPLIDWASIQIRTTNLGNNTYMLEGQGGNITVAVGSDAIIMIDGQFAPLSDKIKAAIRAISPLPIKYLVNTHHHSDHAGGIRAYAAEGIPIITHELQRRYYEQQIFKSPHTLNQDRLARAPKAPVFETVKDKRVLTDGTRTLELHLMRGNLHSEGLLMAYLPKEKILIQADAFAPRPGVPPLPAPSPYTVNLVENIDRLKLDVERVVHVHGGSDPIATVRAAAGRSPTE